jgi:hypothetical protein
MLAVFGIRAASQKIQGTLQVPVRNSQERKKG